MMIVLRIEALYFHYFYLLQYLHFFGSKKDGAESCEIKVLRWFYHKQTLINWYFLHIRENCMENFFGGKFLHFVGPCLVSIISHNRVGLVDDNPTNHISDDRMICFWNCHGVGENDI